MQEKYASAPPYTAGAYQEHHQNLLQREQCQREVCGEELRTVLCPAMPLPATSFRNCGLLLSAIART